MTGSKEEFMEARESEEQSSYGNPPKTTPSDKLIGYLKPLELSKAATEGVSEKIVEMVRNGEMQPLDVVTRLEWLSSVCEEVRKQLREDCVKAARQDGGKETVVNGAKVAIAEVGVSYDFSQSNDPLWKEASEQEKQWSEKKKERQNFLKTIKGSMDVIIEGEPLTLTQPIKSGTTNIKIIFKK